MTDREYQALLDWLADLEKELSPTSDGHQRMSDAQEKQLINLAGLVIKHLDQVVDFKSLDAKLQAERTLNVREMRWLASFFEKLGLVNLKYTDAEDSKNDGLSYIQVLRRFIDECESRMHVSSPRNLSQSLELWGDSLAGTLLREARMQGLDTSPLRQRAEKQIQTLSDEDMRVVAESILEDIESWSARLDSIEVPVFNGKTRSELAAQIAGFVIETYPDMWIRLAEAGHKSIPHIAYGPLRMMSWSEHMAAAIITDEEALALNPLRRLAFQFFPWQLDLPALLRVDPERNLIVGSNKNRKSARMTLFGSERPKPIDAVRDIRRLLRCTTFFEKQKTPLEETLRRLKLATEIRTQDIRADWLTRNEEWHQRNMAHHLTLEGFHASGRKVGRNEPDFIVSGKPEVVVEAKLYKSKAGPSEAQFRANLVQLQSYMEDQPLLRRGVLFVLNFTPSVIIEPREWICGGRYYIVVINLQAATPSKRRSSITIEGDDQNTIKWTKT